MVDTKAIILSYRRGRHTQKMNQILVEIAGIDTKAKASKFIGNRLVWITPSKKEIHGKITHAHGNNGVLRARFTKGLPGTVVGKHIKLV
ncbi:MAG: 50S ribosomal protein L35ae [Nanoarchaeota archaeon]|nr:50S ribosomal protein L35ae [Nanoarchaeota archaeon]